MEVPIKEVDTPVLLDAFQPLVGNLLPNSKACLKLLEGLVPSANREKLLA